MTAWVVLLPPGDTASVHEADVSEAKLVPADQLATWARVEALERELVQARSQLGPQPQPLADVIQIHADPAEQTFRSEDIEVLTCRCTSVYGLNGDPEHDAGIRQAYTAHIRRCPVAANHRTVGGHAEPGEFVWDAGNAGAPEQPRFAG